MRIPREFLPVIGRTIGYALPFACAKAYELISGKDLAPFDYLAASVVAITLGEIIGSEISIRQEESDLVNRIQWLENLVKSGAFR
jgi:hypothetical protein